jgi:hypothetical protein
MTTGSHPSKEALSGSNFIPTVSRFVHFPFVGGSIGFVAYFLGASFLDTIAMSKLEPPIDTYGQQAGMISAPISGAICFAVGIGFAFFVSGYRWFSVVMILGVAILGAASTYSIWYSCGIGRCSSEVVLYYPVVAICAAVVVFATILGIITAAFGKNSRSKIG